MRHRLLFRNCLIFTKHKQGIHWCQVLVNCSLGRSGTWATTRTFRFLTSCSIEERVKAIGLRLWRDSMASELRSSQFNSCLEWHTAIHIDLAFYEYKYPILKEASSVLEPAVWQANELRTGEVRHEINNKKLKMDEAEFRLQCHVSCGADHVIQNVLPYLCP